MNIFDLVAKLVLDSSGYNSGIDAAAAAFSDLENKVKTGVAAVGKVTAAGIAAAAAGAAAIVKSAVDEYADYEQLVGGVETLFGAGGASIEEYAKQHGKSVDAIRSDYNKLMKSQQTVLNYASKAYKSAGLSANEYMDTVTSFSAALLQGLNNDTQAAAEYANKAIVDMADNANKMGTDIKSIQYAYQGFAKQNYTMLDNLKLGYGGTATEMARLVNESGVLNGAFEVTERTINQVPFDKLIEAIHVVQTRMGITGTTAKEAATTIQGSVASMKSAWHNMLVGISDDSQDFDKLMDELVESVETAAANILPRIETSLIGVGELVNKLVPVITSRLPDVVEKVLPNLLSAAASLFSGLAKSIPSLLSATISQVPDILPQLVEVVESLVVELGRTLVDSAPKLIEFATQLVEKFVGYMVEKLPNAMSEIAQFIVKLAGMLTDPDMLDRLIEAAMDLVIALSEGLVESAPMLADAIPEIVFNIVQALTDPDMLMKVGEAAFKLMWSMVLVIPKFCVELMLKFGEVWNVLFDVLEDPEKMNDLKEAGKNVLRKFWEGIKSNFTWLYDKVTGAIDDMVEKIGKVFPWLKPLFSGQKTFNVKASGYGYSGGGGKISSYSGQTDYANASLPTSRQTKNNYTAFNGLNINVRAETNSSPEDIADVVAKRLQLMADRNGAAYAQY